jgi:integrase
MATFRRRKGKWQVQVRKLGHPPLSRTFIRHADAISWAKQVEIAIDKGDATADSRSLRTITVDALLERYSTAVTVRKRSVVAETVRIKCLRRTELAALSLAAATPERFAAYRDRRLAEVAPPTVRKELALLRHMFRLARQEWGVPLTSNPVAEIESPASGKARNRRLSQDETKNFVAALGRLRNPVMRALIQFALQTGMRRGELLKCQWKHLDRSARTLLIPETKTDIPRTIPLSKAALDTLDALDGPKQGNIFPVTTNAIKLSWERLWAKECPGISKFIVSMLLVISRCILQHSTMLGYSPQ